MVKIFVGGVYGVGKDELLKPQIKKLEDSGIKYFHFGNEMKKILPSDIFHFSGKDIMRYRNKLFKNMLEFENIVVSGYYLAFLNKENSDQRETIHYDNYLKEFDKYVLITANFKDIQKKRLKIAKKNFEDKLILKDHIHQIKLEMSQVKKEFNKLGKIKESYLIYNDFNKLKENQKLLEEIIFK